MQFPGLGRQPRRQPLPIPDDNSQADQILLQQSLARGLTQQRHTLGAAPDEDAAMAMLVQDFRSAIVGGSLDEKSPSGKV